MCVRGTGGCGCGCGADVGVGVRGRGGCGCGCEGCVCETIVSAVCCFGIPSPL